MIDKDYRKGIDDTDRYIALKDSLDMAHLKEKYDDNIRSMLSNKVILAWILKYTLEEFKDALNVITVNLDKNLAESDNKCINMLNTLLNDKLTVSEKSDRFAKEYDITIGKKMETEVTNMCNLSEMIWERGINEGKERGKADGIREGEERGRITVLFDLVKDNILTFEEAAEKAGITVDEFKNKLAVVQQ